jgi:outer membrane protein TolC
VIFPCRSAPEQISISMKTKIVLSLILLATVTVAPGAPVSAQAGSEPQHVAQASLPASSGGILPPVSSAEKSAEPHRAGPEAGAPLQLTPELITQFANEMAAQHPALLAARARTNAAAANVKSVRTWEDPMARIGGMSAERMMRRDDGDVFYGAEQKLPVFGQPGAMRKMAAAELAVEAATEDMKFQTLRSDLAKALFRAAFADETISVGEQDLAWLDTTTTVVEESYRSGRARLMDVLTLQNEQSKRAEQLKTDRDNRAQAILAVNRFLNRELDAAWPRLQLPLLAGPVEYSPRLVSYALAQAPELKRMREEIRMAEAAETVARKARWPEVTVGFENRTYARDNDLRSTEFMLGFSIPLGNSSKYRAAIRREEEKRRAAEFEEQNARQAVREEVHGLVVKISAARREAVLYRDQITPRSEQALASARAMFESGGALRDVLDARRMWLEGKLMYARAVAEQYEMLSELILCCGLGDLEALQMVGAQPEFPNGENHP